MPWSRLRDSLLRPPPERQGAHPDPADPDSVPPVQPDWQVALVDSAPAKAFALAMQSPTEPDVRSGVLHELSVYWKRDLHETLERCVYAEDYAAADWKKGDRDSADGLTEFYQENESWAYDLLWYDYLRTCGYAPSIATDIAAWLGENSTPGTTLDYGTGTGTTSMMFHHLGWKATMGDISMPLLDFSRWRVAQRGLPIESIDLREPMPANAYDVITAINTFAHVPNVYESASALHAAMRPGGYLFADFDLREPSDYNAWHLYSQEFTLQWDIRRAGFRRLDTRLAGGQMQIFRREDRRSPAHLLRLVGDAFHYGPPSRIYWRGRRNAKRLARRIALTIWGRGQ